MHPSLSAPSVDTRPAASPLWYLVGLLYGIPVFGIIMLTGVWSRMHERLGSLPITGHVMRGIGALSDRFFRGFGRLFIAEEASLEIVPYLFLPVVYIGLIAAMVREFHPGLAVLYLVVLMGPQIKFYSGITAILHRNAHRPGCFVSPGLKNAQWYFCEWFLGLFHGTVPGSLPYSHCRMHHVCDNDLTDPASTLPFQRDSLIDFIRYATGPAILYISGFSPLWFFYRRKRQQTFRNLGLCMLAYYGTFIVLLMWNWRIAITVQLMPVLLNAASFSIANWVQHGFVNHANPSSKETGSTTLLEPKLLLNENHHHAHHIKPSNQWHQDPIWFENNVSKMAASDPFIFDTLPTIKVLAYMLTKNWNALAQHYVITNPDRKPEEVPMMLARAAQPVV